MIFPLNKRVVLWVSGILAATIFCLGVIYAAWYSSEPLKLNYNLMSVQVAQPLAVKFNLEVSDRLNYNITPATPGHWEKMRGVVGITGLKFIPDKPFVPGSRHQIILGSIKKIGSETPVVAEQVIPVATEVPSKIDSLSPSDQAANVPIDAALILKLKTPNHGLRQLELTSDAPIPLVKTSSPDDTTFTWKFSAPLSQGTTYHLTLKDLNQPDVAKQVLLVRAFTTVPEPKITSATSKDHFYPGDAITINFDQPMKQVDNIFKFNFAGTGKWLSPTSYQFTPSGLAAGQSYSYIVLKGANSTFGGVTQADHTYAVTPPGAVYVTGISPRGSGNSLNSTIAVSFDQPVDHASAQAAFSISPGINGNFSWNGNTMSFAPAGLQYQTTYSVGVGAGVKSVYGLPSNRGFSGSFSTLLQTIRLNVPYYHQQYTLSCEESSLRMALGYRGIGVSDLDVLSRVGYNPRPRDMATNSWDNPYQMFVGDVNGVEGSTGWGVYSPRIAAAAQSFGRNADTITGISVNQIAAAIHGGNPVVLWGYSGSSPRMDAWNTSSGVVQAPKNEHARLVVGVVGSPSAPAGFYINDPIYGSFYWSTGQLIANMSFNGLLPSQGVIVY